MNAAVASATEQSLTPQELEQGRLFLEQTRNSVIGATRGLSEAQWKFKPSPDRWSIAGNLDHIVTVQERVLGPVLGLLATAPAPPAGFDARLIDAIVIHQFPTRLDKFQAPEFVRPAGEIVPSELLERLVANYKDLKERLETTTCLRQHAIESPPLKAVSKGTHSLMDGYHWILAAGAHTERHVRQMLEVMADPSYPA